MDSEISNYNLTGTWLHTPAPGRLVIDDSCVIGIKVGEIPRNQYAAFQTHVAEIASRLLESEIAALARDNYLGWPVHVLCELHLHGNYIKIADGCQAVKSTLVTLMTKEALSYIADEEQRGIIVPSVYCRSLNRTNSPIS